MDKIKTKIQTGKSSNNLKIHEKNSHTKIKKPQNFLHSLKYILNCFICMSLYI